MLRPGLPRAVEGTRLWVLYLLRDIKNQLLTIAWMVFDTFLLIPLPRFAPADVLLICRMDAIGDYVLFRNYLEDIRRAPGYCRHKLVLVLNDQVKPFASELDRGIVDEFIWIDAKRIATDPVRRFRTFHRIRAIRSGTVWNPVFSREYILGDAIVRASAAPRRSGCRTRPILMPRWQCRAADLIYNELIENTPGVLFESSRNAETVARFLGLPHVDPKLKIGIDMLFPSPVKGPYCCLVPGAGGSRWLGGAKEWTVEGFAAAAHHLKDAWGLPCVILGTRSQKQLAASIAKHAGDPPWMLDLTGRTLPQEFIQIIGCARAVVSVDTSAVHIGAATGRPVVCISSGKTIGRFTDYPAQEYPLIKHVYPEGLAVRIQRLGYAEVAERFRNSSPYSASEVDPAAVCAAIDMVMIRAEAQSDR